MTLIFPHCQSATSALVPRVSSTAAWNCRPHRNADASKYGFLQHFRQPFLTSDGTAVHLNCMDKGPKTMFIETSSSDAALTALKPRCVEGETMAFVPNFQVFSTGHANGTVREHNGGKFVMKCQAEGDPDVTVRLALFPVEAPAHGVLSHVMYLKRQTFQESGMNSFCYANNAKPAGKLSHGDIHPSHRNVKVYAGVWNFAAAAPNHNESVWVHQLIEFNDRCAWIRHIGFSDTKSIIASYIQYSSCNYKIFTSNQ